MRHSVKAVFDRLEERFTRTPKRWQERPRPQWHTRLWPSRSLKPGQPFPLRLYLRETLVPVALWGAVVSLEWILPVAYIWHRFPRFFRRALLHHGPAHKLLVGLLAHLGFYQMPFLLLILAGSSLLLELPRCYFWNRRAARIKLEPMNIQTAAADVLEVDLSIWPPSPHPPVV